MPRHLRLRRSLTRTPRVTDLEKAPKISNSDLSFSFSLQASSSSTLRFYATYRYRVVPGPLSDLTIAINMHMRNSEYSSSYLLPPPPRGVIGLPVRVWRDPTSAISIRKAGQVSSYISPPCGERKGRVLVPMGGLLRRLCARKRGT